MNLNEIKKYPISQESILKIQKIFAQESELLTKEELYSLKLLLANQYLGLNMVENALQIYDALSLLSLENKNLYIELLSGYIHSYILIGNFTEAKAYIEEKKKHVDFSNQFSVILDEMEYLFGIGKFDQALNISKDIIIEDLSGKELCGFYEIQLKIFDKIRKYETMGEVADKLCQASLKYDQIDSYYLSKFYAAYYKFKLRYDSDCIEILDTLIREKKNIKPNLFIRVITLYMESLVQSESYFKASTFEAEYEDFIESSQDYESKKNYYKICVQLYKELNNKFSLDTYEKRSEKNNKNLQLERKKLKERKNIKSNFVSSSQEEVSKEKEEEVFEENEDIVQKKEVFLNETWIKKIYDIEIFLPVDLIFREYLRLFMIQFEKLFPCLEIRFSHFANQRIDTFQYKKERLYDRVRNDSDFYQSLESDFLSQNDTSKRYLFSEANEKNDFFLNKKYTLIEKQEIDLTRNSEDSLLEIILNTEDMKLEIEEWNSIQEELLKILENRYCSSVRLSSIVSKYQRYQSFFEDYDFPCFIYSIEEEVLTVNHAFQDLTNSLGTMTLTEFLNSLNPENYHTIRNLFSSLSKGEISYTKEMVQFTKNSSILYELTIRKASSKANSFLIGYCINVTKEIEKKAQIEKKQIIDSITGLNTIHQLSYDLEKSELEKFTIVKLCLEDYKSMISPLDFNMGIQVLQSIGQILLEGKYPYSFYHYESNDFYILMSDINDVRTVRASMQALMNHLEEALKLKFPNESFTFTCTSIRYPNVTKDKNLVKILRYLETIYAYMDRNRKTKESVFFDFTTTQYKNAILEKNILYEVTKSMEEGNLSIQYLQIVDLEKKKVIGYYPGIQIPGYKIPSNVLYKAMLHHKISYQFETYIAKKIIQDLKECYEETKHYVSIYLPVREKTLFFEPFEHLFLNKSDYSIPTNVFRFICNSDFIEKDSLIPDKDDHTKLLNSTLEKYKKQGIFIYTDSMSKLLTYPYQGFYYTRTPYLNKNKDLEEKVIMNYITFLKSISYDFIIDSIQTSDDFEAMMKLGAPKAMGEYLGHKMSIHDIIYKMKGTQNNKE